MLNLVSRRQASFCHSLDRLLFIKSKNQRTNKQKKKLEKKINSTLQAQMVPDLNKLREAMTVGKTPTIMCFPKFGVTLCQKRKKMQLGVWVGQRKGMNIVAIYFF